VPNLRCSIVGLDGRRSRSLLGRSRRASAAGPFPVGDLTRYELRVFSQNGEDGVLAEIMRRLGVSGRNLVEFGIESGAEGNCVFLARRIWLEWGVSRSRPGSVRPARGQVPMV
jgi:hypothetical protein